MALKIEHIKRPDFNYIEVKDIKSIVCEKTGKEYVLIPKKEYEDLKHKAFNLFVEASNILAK